MQRKEVQDLGMDIRWTESLCSTERPVGGHQPSSLDTHHQATHISKGRLVLLPLPSDSEETLRNRPRPNTLPLDGSFQSLEMKTGLRG